VPGGSVVVAEMSQPFGPIAAEAAGIWYRLAFGLAIALAAAIALFAMTFRARATVAAAVTVPSAPVAGHADIRALEVAKQQAEKRAAASERDLKEVQRQFRTALDELKIMEARLEMHQSHASTNDDDLQALRDQLRETSEGLHKAEMDNNALRERVAIRQYELDDLKSRFAQAQAEAEARAQEQTSRPTQVDELLSRLETAERRAADMEGEVERIESELVSTAERFHLAKLSEALREYDNDDDDELDESDEISVRQVEEDDDLFEHPKVFFGVRPRVTNGKVR
jgi:chromosome segregation ATPase